MVGVGDTMGENDYSGGRWGVTGAGAMEGEGARSKRWKNKRTKATPFVIQKK